MQQLLDQPSYIRHKFIQHADGHNNDIIKEEDHHLNEGDAEPSFDSADNATKEEESKIEVPDAENQEPHTTEIPDTNQPTHTE